MNGLEFDEQMFVLDSVCCFAAVKVKVVRIGFISLSRSWNLFEH